MDQAEAEAIVASRPWWYHRFEIFPGVVTPGVYDPSGTLSELGLPDDMTGMTVLEIGPADGYFTKMLTARGASVTAVDYAAKDFYGFADMERLSGRKFRFIRANVYELDTLPIEPFDVVICLGVLYHLPDPCRALWSLRRYAKGTFILETLVSRKHEDEPFAEYLPGDSNNQDFTNFWAPNPLCCDRMLADAGFVVESQWINESRGMFRCRVHAGTRTSRKMEVAYDYLSA